MDDQLFFLRGEGTTLEVRSEVVDPTESTALPASLQAGIPGHIAPTPLPICYHVVHQLVILLRRPQPLPQLVAIPCRSINIAMTSSVAVVANVGLPHFDNRFDGYPDIVLQVYTILPTSLMGMMRGTFILLPELGKRSSGGGTYKTSSSTFMSG